MKHPVVAGFALMCLAGTASAAGLQWGEKGFPGSPAPSATTWRATCGQIQSLVNANGHAMLTFSERGALYLSGYRGTDRVVRDQRYCLTGEDTQPVWVKTRDTEACFAGFTCEGGASSFGKRAR